MTRYRGTFWTNEGPVAVTLSATDPVDATRIVRRYAHVAFGGRAITHHGGRPGEHCMARVRVVLEADARAA